MSGAGTDSAKREPGFAVILKSLAHLRDAVESHSKAVIELRARVIGIQQPSERIEKEPTPLTVGGAASEMYELIRSTRRSLRDANDHVDALLQEFPAPAPAGPTMERIR